MIFPYLTYIRVCPSISYSIFQDHHELPGLPQPPLLHLCVRRPDVLVRVGHARHLSGGEDWSWNSHSSHFSVQADKWTGGNVTMVTSTDTLHLPMVLQVRGETVMKWLNISVSFVRFITPSGSRTSRTSVFHSMDTAATCVSPHQVLLSSTILS